MGAMHWLFLAGPAFALFWNTYFLLVRPARKRHRDQRTEAAKPVPERREPRDTTRPYPRDRWTVRPDDERLSVCPVCGMNDELFLDGGPDQGDLMGWPAHRTCAEWLGDWKAPQAVSNATGGFRIADGAPASSPPMTSLPPTARETRQMSPAPAMPLTREWVMDRAAEAVRAQTDALKAGMITMDELRERIVGAFGIPEMVITATGADAGSVTCDCGMCFNGTAADLDRSMEAHRTSGQHEQRAAYNDRMRP